MKVARKWFLSSVFAVEVIERWFRLYSPDVFFVDKFRCGEVSLPGEDMALARQSNPEGQYTC